MTPLYRLSCWFFFLWYRLLHFYTVVGKENFPKKGGFICAANHVSLGDPPAVGAACAHLQLSFMAKKELFENKRWGWWFKGTNCIPISRNKRDFTATKEALRRLKNGSAIALFPEGTRSETGEMKEAEMGIGFLAYKAHVPVVPIYIFGTGEALGKKGRYNVFVPIGIIIGEPLYFDDLEHIGNKRKKYEFIADSIMNKIAEIKSEYEAGKAR